VNAHDTLFAVGYQGEPVLDRMETAVSAVSYLQRGIETILQAELRPIVLLLVGQNQYDANIGIDRAKSIYGPHQHRASAYGQELLGHISPHSQSLSAGNYDSVAFHSLISCV
jgi:hypothetical protein